MDKISILYCPNHWGLGRQKKKRELITSALDSAGLQYDFVQSESAESVGRLVTMMADNGYTTIVICGGDSAISSAVNSLMHSEQSIRQQVRIAIIPNGVMNDFADFWGLTKDDISLSIAAIAKGRTRRVDVGCLRYRDRRGTEQHRYFINCLNIGLVAALQRLRQRTRSFFGSRTISYISSLLLIVTQRLDYHMHFRINGEDEQRRVMTMCIGNAQGYGQTPNAVPYNGLLDVSVVRNAPVLQLFAGIRLFLSRRFLMHRGVHPYRTRQVDIISAPTAPVALDGHYLGQLQGDYTVTVQAEQVNLIIP